MVIFFFLSCTFLVSNCMEDISLVSFIKKKLLGAESFNHFRKEVDIPVSYPKAKCHLSLL